MEEFGERLERYEAEFACTSNRLAAEPNGSEPVAGAVVSAATAFAGQIEQRNQLDEIRSAFNNLKKMVDGLQNRMQEQEEKLDDREQYGRSNCLILHKCEMCQNGGCIWSMNRMFAKC